MSILRRALPSDPMALTFEVEPAGYDPALLLHGGSCPLTGQLRRGVPGPFCTSACQNPNPLIRVMYTHIGLVVDVQDTTAIIWNIVEGHPESITPAHDDKWVPRITKDALPGIQDLYEYWMLERLYAEQARDEDIKRRVRQQQQEVLLAEMIEKEEMDKIRAEQARIEAIERDRLAKIEVERQRKLRSHIRKGVEVRIVCNDPDQERMWKGIKSRNRPPSVVGLNAIVTEETSYADPWIWIRLLEEGRTLRVKRFQLRAILPDGSLADEDTPPPRLK